MSMCKHQEKCILTEIPSLLSPNRGPIGMYLLHYGMPGSVHNYSCELASDGSSWAWTIPYLIIWLRLGQTDRDCSLADVYWFLLIFQLVWRTISIFRIKQGWWRMGLEYMFFNLYPLYFVKIIQCVGLQCLQSVKLSLLSYHQSIYS